MGLGPIIDCTLVVQTCHKSAQSIHRPMRALAGPVGGARRTASSPPAVQAVPQPAASQTRACSRFRRLVSSLPFPVSPFSSASVGSPYSGYSSPLLASFLRNPRLEFARGGRNRGARMTVIDILTRVDAICQKYDKYDVDKLNGANVAGDDPFARLYASVDADINQCVEVRSRPPFSSSSSSLSASATQSTRSESDDRLFGVWNRKRKQQSKRRTGPRWWRLTPRSGAPRPSSSRRTCPSCSASP